MSLEQQRETVARLAEQNRHTLEHEYRDWGRSGAKKGRTTRTHYRQMIEDMEAGTVTSVYAYDQDRLARDVLYFQLLMEACDDYGVPVYTAAGNIADEEQRFAAQVRAAADENEARKIGKRSAAIARKRRRRGDNLGMVPMGYEQSVSTGNGERYAIASPGLDGKGAHAVGDSVPVGAIYYRRAGDDDIAHVVDTYKREGSYIGTARALNVEGFPSKRGGKWHPVTVGDLIRREAPELAKAVTKGKRSRKSTPRLLAGLLVCHCGGPMSPAVGGKGTLMYYCGRGSRGDHPKPHFVSESRLMDWIKREADRLVLPEEVTLDGPEYDDAEDRAKLAALRDVMGEDAYRAAIANLDAKRAEMGERMQTLEAVPPRIDWEGWDTEDVNRALKSLWKYVELKADLMPKRADWRVPEWRG